MTARSIMVSSFLAAALILGCDKKDDTTDRPSAPATPTTPPPGGPVQGPTNTLPGMTQLQNQATTQMQGMQAQGQQAAQNVQGQVGALTDDAITAAQTKLDQVKQAIASGKWTDADHILKGVETMRAQLPKAQQDQIDALRKQITSAMDRLKAPTTAPTR